MNTRHIHKSDKKNTKANHVSLHSTHSSLVDECAPHAEAHAAPSQVLPLVLGRRPLKSASRVPWRGQPRGGPAQRVGAAPRLYGGPRACWRRKHRIRRRGSILIVIHANGIAAQNTSYNTMDTKAQAALNSNGSDTCVYGKPQTSSKEIVTIATIHPSPRSSML